MIIYDAGNENSNTSLLVSKFVIMAFIRSFIISAIIFLLSNFVGLIFETSIMLAIICFFAYESMNKEMEINKLSRNFEKSKEHIIKMKNNILTMEEHLQNNEHQLSLTRGHLQDSLDELDRRDAIGTPIVRELMIKQEEALKLQEKAMDEAKMLTEGQKQLLIMQSEGREELHLQNMQIFESLEKILSLHANQNFSIQKQIIEENINFQTSIINSNNEFKEILSSFLNELQTNSKIIEKENLPIVKARPVKYAGRRNSNRVKAS